MGYPPPPAEDGVPGLSQVANCLHRLLAESGDPAGTAEFDVDSWLAKWMRQPLLELGDKTPAEALRNLGGLYEVLRVLERMRGGIAA